MDFNSGFVFVFIKVSRVWKIRSKSLLILKKLVRIQKYLEKGR